MNKCRFCHIKPEPKESIIEIKEIIKMMESKYKQLEKWHNECPNDVTLKHHSYWKMRHYEIEIDAMKERLIEARQARANRLEWETERLVDRSVVRLPAAEWREE